MLLVVPMLHDALESDFKKVRDCAYKVHTALGPGLLESAYEACLKYELTKAGLKAETQKALPLIYEEVKLDTGYRIDMHVNNHIIVEIKTVESLTDVHLAQVLTYMRLTDCKLGLLGNFKQGIKRVVL